ncbi:MarR family transcriptional regulator [Roseiarcaceae bacterium H3SJ34-1]|uniref:MarR family winged helix-turn-helix transcriptional regulator n=1 Tax=Terripilifer ovatus TaxID=3032367 RepID=UPI003AB926A8|nr:MarR family transcriptional regulator [Roseiarcaceae bacterium H3SJ34-1]
MKNQDGGARAAAELQAHPEALDYPPSDAIAAAKIMVLATNLRRSAAALYAREFDLGGQAWRLLSVIGLRGPMSLGELADRLGYDKGLASREVTALVRRGLVLKIRPARAVCIQLSPSGESLMRKLHELSRQRDEFLLADLSVEERRIFNQQLDRMAARARALLDQGEA